MSIEMLSLILRKIFCREAFVNMVEVLFQDLKIRVKFGGRFPEFYTIGKIVK